MQRTADWNEDTFGDGPGCYACHVKIPSKFHHLVSEDEPEVQEGELARDTYQHTYLHACAVRLCCAVLCLPEIDSPVITDCLSDWLLLRAWLT